MSDITAVSTIRLVEAVEEPRTIPAAEAIAVGAVIGINSDGKAVNARATTGPILPHGMALNAAAAAGMPVSIIRDGLVDVGNILTGLAYGALVYASDTAGRLADGSVNSLAAIAEVVPVFSSSVADKLLRVKFIAR
jgi:hypothetical protein